MKLSLIILFFISISSSAVGQSGDDLHSWVRGIEGRTPEGRREWVKTQLKKIGIPHRTEAFSRTLKFGTMERTIAGENIIATIGKGRKNIVVGAHYDAVPRSPGANDNGGGVAVLLGLLHWSKSVEWNHRITFCFFDQEETGLNGSHEFARTYADSSVHLAMINLDVEGMGDALFVGPVGGGDNDVLLPFVRQAAKTLAVPYHETDAYPPSDHLSFAQRNLENISVSVVPSSDVPLLIETVKSGWQPDPSRLPEVLKLMHTPRDSSTYVSPDALSLSFRLVKQTLTLLNESLR